MADDNRTDVPERKGDVLGISNVTPPRTSADQELASEPAAPRRRRAEDVERLEERRESDTGADDPRGLHVER